MKENEGNTVQAGAVLRYDRAKRIEKQMERDNKKEREEEGVEMNDKQREVGKTKNKMQINLPNTSRLQF